MRYLTSEEILRLHYRVIKDYGGSHGVRDESRLSAVVVAPNQQTFGVSQYDSIYKKAAVYFRNIIADHPFIDGNKRTATVVTAIFLTRNNLDLTAHPKDLEDYAVYIATDKPTVADIAKWLKDHTKTKS